MLGWIGNDQSMQMRETSRGQDKKLGDNNNPKKKVDQIPNVELEFKYGSNPITKVIHNGDKDVEVIGFGNLEGLSPKLIDDTVMFFDSNGTEVAFIDEDSIDNVENGDSVIFRPLVFTTDYTANYNSGLSPIPSSVKSKYNALGAIRNGFESRMDGVDKVFSLVVAFSSYGFE